MWGRDARKGVRCVYLKGVKEKEEANRDWGVPAPRLGQTRCGDSAKSVKGELGKGG